jgi:hypothetical protein
MALPLIIIALLALAVAYFLFFRRRKVTRADPSMVESWEIGPIINGHNYSVGIALHPRKTSDGFVIDIPQSPGHVHYVTFQHGPLDDKRIIMDFRVEASDGVTIHPRNYPTTIGTLTLYFQRFADDWSGDGKYETYRWYASSASLALVPGETHRLTLSATDWWSAVRSSTVATAPDEYHAARANTDRVGFVLGGGDGIGHGVYATGPARIVVTRFEVV